MKSNKTPKNIMTAIFAIVALAIAATLLILAAFVWVSPIIFFAALAAACFALDAVKRTVRDARCAMHDA